MRGICGVSSLKTPPKDKDSLKIALKKQWKLDQASGKHLKLIQSFGKRLKELKKNDFFFFVKYFVFFHDCTLIFLINVMIMFSIIK